MFTPLLDLAALANIGLKVVYAASCSDAATLPLSLLLFSLPT
jgi:hypothetical protein